MKERKGLDGGILFSIFLLLLFIGISLYIFFHIKVDKYTERMKGHYEITHGFIVHDQGQPLITILFFIHPQSKRGALYFVPENTGTIIESQDRMDRIDTLFNPEDPRPYLEKIDRMLGTTTDFYLSMDVQEFGTLIDWMGGLDVFIPQPVWQNDADPMVLLPSGSFRIDGGKIGAYLSYKSPEEREEDLINRKLSITRSFLKALSEQNTAMEKEEYFNWVYSQLNSNLDKQSFSSFITALNQIQTDRMITQRVMGKLRDVDDKMLLFPLYEERLLKEMVAQIIENLANPDINADDGLTISVEIRNGTSINGLASRTAQLYKSYGFRIASVKNADKNDYETTLILDKKENPVAAQRAANLIRCDQVFQSTDTTTDDTVDVIIILGKDFDGRYVK